MKIIGVLLLIGGAMFGLLFLSEFSRWMSLQSGCNTLPGIAMNSAVYCGGIAATATLSGIGFLIASTGRKATAAGPVASP